MTKRPAGENGGQDAPTSSSRDLEIYTEGPFLPEETILTRMAVVGMSGSGKTQTARKLAEAMMDRGQHIGVLDPMGVWWGLRSTADGLKPGYPIVVFGGKQGDAPLEATSGKVLAAAFMEQRFNAIFNMKGWTPVKVRQFATDFLNEVNKHEEQTVHLFLDEFDIICPQAKSSKSEESREACNNTVRRGRSQGIGVTMITQNPQDAEKSVLNMADTVIAMRTQGAHPVDAIRKWMTRGLEKESVSELVRSLGGLQTGAGWVWSPQNHILAVKKFLLCKTYDSSKTPALGESVLPPKVLAPIDIKRLGAEIAATVERVQQESPEFLKRRIAELEAKAGNKTAAPQEPHSELTRALDAERQASARWKREAEDVQKRWEEEKAAQFLRSERAAALPTELSSAVESIGLLVGRGSGLTRREKAEPTPPQQNGNLDVVGFSPPEPLLDRAPSSPPPNLDGQAGLRGKSRDMLAVCARMYPAGMTEAQVAMRSGMKRTSGTFRTYKSLLTTTGAIELRDGLWFATPEGMRRGGANIPGPPLTTEEVLALWRPKLRGKSGEMLDVLVGKRGRAMSYADLAEATGMAASSGTFRTYLSLLRTTGLVEAESGFARANADALFL